MQRTEMLVPALTILTHVFPSPLSNAHLIRSARLALITEQDIITDNGTPKLGV